jgi:hypothetical protein
MATVFFNDPFRFRVAQGRGRIGLLDIGYGGTAVRAAFGGASVLSEGSLSWRPLQNA